MYVKAALDCGHLHSFRRLGVIIYDVWNLKYSAPSERRIRRSERLEIPQSPSPRTCLAVVFDYTRAKSWAETPKSKRIDLTQHLHLSLTLIRDWKGELIVPIIILTRGTNYAQGR